MGRLKFTHMLATTPSPTELCRAAARDSGTREAHRCAIEPVVSSRVFGRMLVTIERIIGQTACQRIGL